MAKSLLCAWSCAMLGVTGILATFAMNYGLVTGAGRIIFGKPDIIHENDIQYLKVLVTIILTGGAFVATIELSK